MKKLLFFLPFSLTLIGAQAPIYMAPPATTYEQPTKTKVPSAQSTDPASAKTAAAVKATQSSGTNEVMIIFPDARGKDIQAAIKYLNTHVPTMKPNVKLANGGEIKGVMDVDVMPGGTILIFKLALSLKAPNIKWSISKRFSRSVNKTVHLIHLQNTPIEEQLKLEEALLRTTDKNWCLINEGSPPSIVMGISGKPDELISKEHIEKNPIPLIKRYSGRRNSHRR